MFDGAVDRFVLSMLAADNVSADELRDLEKLIAKARRAKQKKEEISSTVIRSTPHR